MRRIYERRRPKAHPPGGRHGHPPGESCYRCRHGRGVIRCACRYARKASGWEADHSPRARAAYTGRLIAGLVLLTGRRFGPGVALVAARGVLPKLVPAMAAIPALLKSAWVWIGGLSLATATALSSGTVPAIPGAAVHPAACERPAVEDAACVSGVERSEQPAAEEARGQGPDADVAAQSEEPLAAPVAASATVP
jgi:hypothetical protein